MSPTTAPADEARGGDLLSAFFESLPLRGAADRCVTAADIELRAGMPVAQIQELMVAMGLPPARPGEPSFTPEEAQGLERLWRHREIWPLEFAVQIARLYGRLLARIAQASAQQWLAAAEPRLHAAEPDESRRADAAARVFDDLLPAADAFLTGVHRRWIEREAAQLAVRAAEARASSQLIGGLAEVSILFCDLKDFTAFADRHGDSAAIGMIEEFTAVVTQQRGEDARLSELLGDGFMLVYPEPSDAVRATIRIMAAMRSADRPSIHASIHHGAAVPWQGDYFGTAVNLAARLLAFAEGDELLATAPVVERCSEFAWDRVGRHQLRGVSGDVELFRLSQEAPTNRGLAL
jgi:class 3 adenylate cyclase